METSKTGNYSLKFKENVSGFQGDRQMKTWQEKNKKKN